MSKMDDIQQSLDELFMDIADLNAKVDKVLARQDRRDKRDILMVAHVERLVKDKEFLLRHIGVMQLTMPRGR